jgi:hypothetical protein
MRCQNGTPYYFLPKLEKSPSIGVILCKRGSFNLGHPFQRGVMNCASLEKVKL